MKLTPEYFIAIWQSSKSIAEVLERTGMLPSAVRARVSIYRKRGVPLKKMQGNKGKTRDWAALARFAEQELKKP